MSTQPTITPDISGLNRVRGFRTAATAANIRGKKDGRPDLALVLADRSCTAAGVFTTNDVQAAPVLLCRETLAARESFRGFVINSGNANACTGEDGMRDARVMAEAAARACDVPEGSLFVCSTGRIGERLPLARIELGIDKAALALSDSDEAAAQTARAILTSDTRPKTVLAETELAGQRVTLAGMAKGAGMIDPNMATMLAFLVTDARVPKKQLQEILAAAVDKSFNRITIDGDMSTNDTVLALANGASGAEPAAAEDRDALQAAFDAACATLAEKIVGDGERVTKFVELIIEGARDGADAEKIARAIGNSLLVKTSWFGNDPNWGRLVDAAGYARAGLEFDTLDLFYGDSPVLQKGRPLWELKDDWKAVVARDRFTITLRLHQGRGHCRLLASDLTEGYVNFNKSE